MIARRHVLIAAAGLLVPQAAHATPAEVAGLIAALTGGKPPNVGRVKLDLPELVENGNAVSMTVSVDHPDPVASLHVFAQSNPNPNVLNVRFGPAAGPPRIATRIRLATSQTVIAVARMGDGSFWQDSVELLVTLAACIE
jgi:sulfur-oxidizing protein SoxY